MKQFAVYLASITLAGLSPFCRAGDLDDISIQVIGLEEIPAEALERIPLPGPGMHGLADIREGLILNRPMSPDPSESSPPGAPTVAPGGPPAPGVGTNP